MSHLLVVDGSNLLHRAYHVAPSLVTSTGVPVGGVHGFAWMMFNLIRKTERTRDYTHAVVAWDLPRANWRHAIDPGYKGSRFRKNEDLSAQFALAHECAESFGMTSVSAHGFEADDVIGTYVEKFGAILGLDQSAKVTIVTSDKDLMQLVTDRINVLDTMAKKLIGPEEVFAKMGVVPFSVPMLLAIMGDDSDHIIGLERVGPKTAAKWINKYGSPLELLNALSPQDQAIVRRNLRLVSLRRDISSIPSLSQVAARTVDVRALIKFLDKYEFSKLKRFVFDAWGLPSGVAA